MIDMTFSLYELERDNKSRAIALISGDKDFGHLLSKIHHQPPISHSFLILLRHCHIDRNLCNVVDKVIQLHFAKNDSIFRNSGNNNYESKIASHSIGKNSSSSKHDENKDLNKAVSSERKSKQISIRLECLLRPELCYKLHTDLDTLSDSIRTAIHDKMSSMFPGSKNSQLAVLHKGTELPRNTSLKLLAVNDGDTLKWFYDGIAPKESLFATKKKQAQRSKTATFCVKVQPLNHDVTFGISSYTPIADIRQRIFSIAQNHDFSAKGLPSKKGIILYANGEELFDGKLIQHSVSINEGSVILFDKSQVGCALLNKFSQKQKRKQRAKDSKSTCIINVALVHTDNAYPNTELQTSIKSNIFHLMSKIQRHFDVPGDAKSIRLFYGRKELRADQVLHSYGIDKDVLLLWECSDFEQILPITQKMKHPKNRKKADVRTNGVHKEAKFNPFGYECSESEDENENNDQNMFEMRDQTVAFGDCRRSENQKDRKRVQSKSNVDHARADEISVIVCNGLTAATIVIKKTDSIKDLKQRIQERLQISPCHQKLTCKGQVFGGNNDAELFKMQGLNDGDTIECQHQSREVDGNFLGRETIKYLPVENPHRAGVQEDRVRKHVCP